MLSQAINYDDAPGGWLGIDGREKLGQADNYDDALSTWLSISWQKTRG